MHIREQHHTTMHLLYNVLAIQFAQSSLQATQNPVPIKMQYDGVIILVENCSGNCLWQKRVDYYRFVLLNATKLFCLRKLKEKSLKVIWCNRMCIGKVRFMRSWIKKGFPTLFPAWILHALRNSSCSWHCLGFDIDLSRAVFLCFV